MPLVLNIRHLETRNLRLKGQLSVEELDIDTKDELIRLVGPVEYDFEAQKLEASVLAQGRLRLTLACQCVRCLKPFRHRVELPEWTCHLPLQGEEAASVSNDCVDLTPYVRDDILLEFPPHPLCKPDCDGLPKTYIGKAKTTDREQPTEKASVWAELEKLKLK
jgi:uncharacterized metal-binding protein YceD (DUF177 family)